MLVTIIDDQYNLNIDIELLKRVSGYIADKFDRDKNRELNIIFVERQKIRKLNKEYRNKDCETDVLSFSYEQPNTPGLFDNAHGFMVAGEIIISPEVAKDNSENVDRGYFDSWNLTREIVLLITHGILHLHSFDHEKKHEEVEMENIQNSLLRDVFSVFDI